jgi:hypothetical protein
MKKGKFDVVAVIFAVLTVVLATTGCGSSPAAVDNGGEPDWVLNPPQDDEKLFGIGTAKSTNESRGWKMAESNARNSISYQITTIVEGMQVNYTNQAGNDDAETGQNFFEDVGRQLTANVLNGARVDKRGRSSTGTYYVLVSYSESSLKSAASTVIQSAAKNAQVNANLALQAMDKALAAKRTPELVETGGE